MMMTNANCKKLAAKLRRIAADLELSGAQKAARTKRRRAAARKAVATRRSR